MRRKLIALACVLIAPLAFAQTNTNSSNRTDSSANRQTAPDTAVPPTSNDVMAVDSFTPGSSIVVSSTPTSHSTTYRLGKDVQYVSPSGKQVDPNLIRPGTRVRLEATGDDRHVGRIVVVEE
jgi:hypothetical protein